jgi:hypothetical protein
VQELDEYALRHSAASLRLLKSDLVEMLDGRGVPYKKSETKAKLMEHWVRDVLAEQPESYILEILECLRSGAPTNEEIAKARLSGNADLSDAVDLLATMDFESAQAFPDMAKAQKNRRTSAQPVPARTEVEEPDEDEASCPGEEVGSGADPEAGSESPLSEKDLGDFWEGMVDDIGSHEDDEASEGMLVEGEGTGSPAITEAEVQALFADDESSAEEMGASAGPSRPASSRIYTSPEALRLLCPGGNVLKGVSVTQDFRENRFKAKYEADDIEHLEEILQQKEFSRSYQIRTPREALEAVLEWVWAKHALLTGEVRPPTAFVDFLGEDALKDLLNPDLGHLVR